MVHFILLLLFSSQEAVEAYRQGVALVERGKPGEAVPLLQNAAALAPREAQYWKALGVALASLDQVREAVEPFHKACSLDGRLLDACYYYGRGLYATDRYAEAIAPLQKALTFDPLKGRAESALGQCHEALGHEREAEKFFRSAMARRDRSEQPARLAFGRFLIRHARAEEALSLLEAAQQPETAEARYLLGQALWQLDKPELAVSKLERAVALQPGDLAARVLLAKIYRRLGRTSDAARLEAANSEVR